MLVAWRVQKDKEKEEKSSKVEELQLPEMGIEEKKILKELMKACVFQGMLLLL
jgi:ubiquitin